MDMLERRVTLLSVLRSALSERGVQVRIGAENEAPALHSLADARHIAAFAQADSQLEGMRLFNQSCRVCHTKPQMTSPQYGPPLSRVSLGGNAEAMKTFIANGSARMPAVHDDLSAVRGGVAVGAGAVVAEGDGQLTGQIVGGPDHRHREVLLRGHHLQQRRRAS